jgi:pimeloyl-ACP methyl ester carboxylesterase
MSFDRRRFLALASAPLGLAACGGNNRSLTPPPPTPAPPTLASGQTIDDLRFGIAPTPPTFPGYDPAGDAKALVVAGTPSPATSPVPGTLATGSYATNERYVVRVPTAWNGKLVVAGTPATRSEFANDAIWSDFAIANGYAFASSNKNIPFNAIAEVFSASPDPNNQFVIPYNLANLETLQYSYRLGAVTPTKVNMASWNTDFATLTAAAKNFLHVKFGKAPTRTYAVGLSNGGAQVRSLLEQHPELVDGGVEWSAVYWSTQMNFLLYMPKFLAAMAVYAASGFTDAPSAAAIQAAGYPADIKQNVAAHPSLWFEYFANQASFYADLTVFEYALLLDPAVTSGNTGACVPNAAMPTTVAGTCMSTGIALAANRATYAPSASAAPNIQAIAHTGNIGKPLVGIAGSSDMFITPQNNFAAYRAAVDAAGKGNLYSQYEVVGGTHVDTFAPLGYGLQPQLPFAWAAFDQLVAIVEGGYSSPARGTQLAAAVPTDITS